MKTRREWTRSTWTRPQWPRPLSWTTLPSALEEKIEGFPDDAPVPMKVGELRKVLRDTEPARERGASIRDDERGVTYRVTLDPTPGSVGLRTVEIVSDASVTDPLIFRIPVQVLVSQALAARAWEDAHRNGDGARGIVIGAKRLAPPTPLQLREHLNDGLNVPQIADRYGRKPRVVYGWLATARRSNPGLDWPTPQVNRASYKTPDGKSPSENRRNK